MSVCFLEYGQCFQACLQKGSCELSTFGLQLILILILVDSQAEMLSERMLAKSDAEFVIPNT